MRLAAFVMAAALLVGASPAPISQKDFNELMLVAAADGARHAPTKMVCLSAKLDPPLQSSKRGGDQSNKDAVRNWDEIRPGLGAAFKVALAGRGSLSRQRFISAAPRGMTIIPSPSSTCYKPLKQLFTAAAPLTLVLTRPVFVSRFAFVEYHNACAARLCASGSLLALEKTGAKDWTIVATGLAWVS